MILKTILLSNDLFADFRFEGVSAPKYLEKLNRINIFTGPNNSGKSRFLRSIFLDNTFEFLLYQYDLEKLKSKIDEVTHEIRTNFDSLLINDADGIYNNLKVLQDRKWVFKLNETEKLVTDIRTIATSMTQKRSFQGWSNFKNTISSRDPQGSILRINELGKQIETLTDEIFPENFLYEIHKIYIPILRGLRPIQLNEKKEFIDNQDNYKARTIRDYFQGLEETKQNQIFTGLNLYSNTQNLLLGRKEGRDNIKKFEEFLGECFFHGESVTLIPDINNDVLLIGIGNSERPVYEYGDGIQSLITLLYPLFFNQNKDLLVFIEEPENSLHPGLQRVFLETLMRKEFSKFQFFFTTHSNHFLDLTLDYNNISIYTVKRNEIEESKTVIENVSDSHVRVLDLLGVRNSSVFLSNCTIWIEGITDRLYIRKYLELYQRHLSLTEKDSENFKEDLHYSFIEYAGSNVAHYSFEDKELEKILASSITNKILLIADSDDTLSAPNSGKAKRLLKFRRELKENFIQLKVREIENLLSVNVLLSTISDMENKDIKEFYVDANFIYKNYSQNYLGQFILDNIKPLKRKYADTSGTIYNKMAFCKSALENLHDYDDLSKDAMQMIEKIYKFISSSNAGKY